MGVSRRSDCRIFKKEISEVMDLLVVSMSGIKMSELLSKVGWRRRRSSYREDKDTFINMKVRETTFGCEYQVGRIIGSHLGGWLTQNVK